MHDTYGDGWNGAYWTWSSDDGQSESGTLESGSDGTACLGDGSSSCITFYVSGGQYPGEVQWSLSDGQSGGAGDSITYGDCSDGDDTTGGDTTEPDDDGEPKCCSLPW
jgi:hypothetical protein